MPSYRQLNRKAEAIITNLASGKTIVVEDLRITFNIKKKATKSVNSVNRASIIIYNMSASSRKLIESVADGKGNPQTQIELKVGYASIKTELIFKGRCEVSSHYSAPHWVTKLTGEDGLSQFNYAYEKTFSKGTTIGTIVEDIATQSGIKGSSKTKITTQLKKSRTFSGPPLQIIKSLQKTYGFVFDIQDEGTIVRSNKYQVDKEFLIQMSYARGLLGEPRRQGDLVVIDTLINPAIRPNSFIELESKARSDFNGKYSIQKVTTKGDSYSGPWAMTVELMDAKAVEKIATKGK